jgi:hypothetical protein
MIIGNKEINEIWVAAKTQTEFVEYGLTKWANHADMKRKTKTQKTAYLKAIWKQCKEAVGEIIPTDEAPIVVNDEDKTKGAE